jgi:MFS family permease
MTTATPQRALQSIIRQARLSPRHYWLWLVSTGGTFIDGYTTLMTGVAFPLLKAQEHPGAIIIGLLGAALVAGAVLGASLGGAMADRYGRKLIYLADMTLLAGAALMLALS